MNEKKAVVLFNDADPVLARVCRAKFQKATGWEAFVSASLDEALSAITEQGPQLVITELVISDDAGRSGFDLIKGIRELPGDAGKAKIVVFSDLAQDDDKDKAKELGADAYFVKNEVSIQNLIGEIQKMLD